MILSKSQLTFPSAYTPLLEIPVGAEITPLLLTSLGMDKSPVTTLFGKVIIWLLANRVRKAGASVSKLVGKTPI